jgi:long-subunit acyl-CoA synthetase (AMP-forming)
VSSRNALTDGLDTLTADELATCAAQVSSLLRAATPRIGVLAVLADNGIGWVVMDRAAAAARVPFVPLPPFFTPAQIAHALDATGADALVAADERAGHALGFGDAFPLVGTRLVLLRRQVRNAPPLPPGTAKVTFTSGTTGTPKGVCLDDDQQWRVAESIASALRDVPIERHLCLLPLSLLLENIAGIYAPLVRGATACVPPLAVTGLRGSSAFDPVTCLRAVERFAPHSAIVLPQMLLALTLAIERGARAPSSLRFLAVGGARVAPSLIVRARAAGLPAYEGYGLSECASVVALNVPDADRVGSVGRPLAHVRVTTDSQREIVVRGSTFLGYAGESRARDASPLPTGDAGSLDDAGFLHIEGRRKGILITGFGRNVSPEWPESELTADGVVAQAAVFGESRPVLCAVLVPCDPAIDDARLAAAVAAANARLPDYARIGPWVRADAPFGPDNGLATANGRVRRDAILDCYRARLDHLYESQHAVP